MDATAKELVKRKISIAWGGIVAQNRLTGHLDNVLIGGWDDYGQAIRWARFLAPEGDEVTFAFQVRAEIQEFFDGPNHWAAVCHLAEELLIHHRLDGKKVGEIVSAVLVSQAF